MDGLDKVFRNIASFVVTRSSWLRGKGNCTKLLNEIGERDCLGFYMSACGFADARLLCADEPIDAMMLRRNEILVKWITPLFTWYGDSVCETKLCYQIIQINDAPYSSLISDQELDSIREAKLINLFGSMGVTLVFED